MNAMTDREIRELALKMVDRRVFGSWGVPPEMWQLVFMPLAFADTATLKKWKKEGVAHVYAIVGEDVTTQRAINGYPMFAAMRVISERDFLKLKIATNMAEKQRAQFLGAP